jgi:hypothetical protein
MLTLQEGLLFARCGCIENPGTRLRVLRKMLLGQNEVSAWSSTEGIDVASTITFFIT